MSMSVAKALCVENRIVILGRPTKDNGFHLDSVGEKILPVTAYATAGT